MANPNLQLLNDAAKFLGELVFVGGCATALLGEVESLIKSLKLQKTRVFVAPSEERAASVG